MIYMLFFAGVSLFGWDYHPFDLSHIDRDQYECGVVENSIQKLIEYKTHYGSIYKVTECTGAIQSRFKKAQLSDFHYDNSIPYIDGFMYDYSLSFQAQKNHDLKRIYTDYTETMHERLVRFYSLVGLNRSEYNNVINFYTYSFVPYNRYLESVIDTVKWDCGSLSQLKLMMAVFLDDPKYIVYASMLKKSLSPAQLPIIDGDNFVRKPKSDQKTDILCSNSPDKLTLFQLGKIFYPVKLITLSENCTLAGKDERVVLPDEDSWIALYPDATRVLTYDRKTHALISMNISQDTHKKKNEVLFISPQHAHIQHGIFINNDLLLLAVFAENKMCNIVYDKVQKKFWMLPDTIRFQHFLIADESIFPGHYVVGGFSSQDERFQRWISQTKIPKKDYFSCATDAFSLNQFSLNDTQSITFNDKI